MAQKLGFFLGRQAGATFSVAAGFGPQANTFNRSVTLTLANPANWQIRAVCTGKLAFNWLGASYTIRIEPGIEAVVADASGILANGFEPVSAFVITGVADIDPGFLSLDFQRFRSTGAVYDEFRRQYGADATLEEYKVWLLQRSLPHTSLLPMDVGTTIARPSATITFAVETTQPTRDYLGEANVCDPAFFWKQVLGRNELKAEDVALANEVLAALPARRIIEIRDEYNAPVSDAPGAPGTGSADHVGKVSLTLADGTVVSGAQLIRGCHALPGAGDGAVSVGITYAPLAAGTHNSFVVWDSFGRSSSWSSKTISVPGAPHHVVVYGIAPAHWLAEQFAKSGDFTAGFPATAGQARRELERYSTGNRASALIDGPEYFSDLSGTLASIDLADSSHFVHFAGWSFYNNLVIVANYPELAGTDYDNKYGTAYLKFVQDNAQQTLRQFITRYRDRLIIQFYDPDALLFPDQDTEADSLEEHLETLNIPRRWLRDEKVADAGAIHMKVITARGQQGLIGYCGGIDLWPSRLTGPGHSTANGETWAEHDVQVKVLGPAASELDLVLHQRWADVRRAALLADDPFQPPAKAASVGGPHIVQVARTLPDDADMGPFSPGEYSFAVNGDNTIYRTVERAIAAARQYIYVEDQYFRDRSLIPLFAAAIRRVKFVVVVIPYANWTADPMPGEMDPRNLAVTLRNQVGSAIFDEKVRFCHLATGNREIYVHTKVQIVDDVFVSCGSANLDRNGLAVDLARDASQECNVMVVDETVTGSGTREFARDLRMRLWAHHFNRPKQSFVDPLKSYKEFWSPKKAKHNVRFFPIP